MTAARQVLTTVKALAHDDVSCAIESVGVKPFHHGNEAGYIMSAGSSHVAFAEDHDRITVFRAGQRSTFPEVESAAQFVFLALSS